MLKDLASQKKSDKEVILAAITSLKAKGWHINPYTVADEAGIARSVVVRSSEYMDIVSRARGKAVATPNQVSDELMRQVDLLEEENRGLKDRLAAITQQAELLAQNVQEAFQQGIEHAKAEQTLASELQSIVRTGTADSAAPPQQNEFTNHVPHSQFYAPQNYEQGGAYDQYQQHPTYYEEQQAAEPTAEFQKPVAHGDNEYQQQAEQLRQAEHQQQAEYQQQAEHQQQAEYQQQAGYPQGEYQHGEADDTFDPQNVETAEHEVYIASHIPELQEDTGIDAFSARLLATLNTEGEEEAEPEQGVAGPRYDTGEFAETEIPDWDAMAGVADEGWEESAQPEVPQPEVPVYHQAVMPQIQPLEPSEDLSAVGTSIPQAAPADSKNKFSADDLRQLVTHKLEGTSSGVHDDAVVEAASATPHAAPTPSNKFVGANRQGEAPISAAPVSRMVPPEIRKACLILGIKSDEITRENVNKAWKSEMAKPGVHPDTGGDTEIAIYINNAKESLMKWLEMQAPKLGKKFGSGSGGGGGGTGGGKPK